jgi:ADP-L-glycero-D-manno-heptose 6-epimerase
MFEERDCVDETVRGFLNVVEFCQDRQIKLIYPSSGTIYGNQMNAYSNTKTALEYIHRADNLSALGLRIFAGYGEGEESKGKYASIIYQFAKMMKQNQRPIVWGDVEAVRDYVYIDDIVDNIVDNLDREGFMDIGTGVGTSSKEIISAINEISGWNVKPMYKPRPSWHVDSIVCSDPSPYKYDIHLGIKRLLEKL